ncbi:MAG: hypothetical protein HC767_00780 [Akkermansiaceae bacterium]|nr:hypothetical protein [Akkermansiaceae bacterium]
MKLPLLIFALLFPSAVMVFGQVPAQPFEINRVPGGQVNLQWLGIYPRTYFLQQSTGLNQDWTYFPTVIESGNGLPMGWSVMVSGTPKMFFRLHYTDVPTSDPAMMDFDGDGVASIYELQLLGTSPLIANTDGVGASDGGGDADGDGLPDALELHFLAI